MRQQKIIPLFLVVIACFSACANDPAAEERAMNEYLASADSVATSSSPDLADLTSDARKVIRKAYIRCRVDNVAHAVKELEQFAEDAGGFVQSSHTENDIISEKSVVYQSDSLKTAQLYRTTATMVIRVPYFALDTLSARIGGMASFIHHRDMNREDVTLQFLSNALKNRTFIHAKEVTSAKNKQPGTDGGVLAHDQASQQVDRRIANLAIVDDTRYATLSLEIYQPEQTVFMITQNAGKMVEPAFAEQLGAAVGKSIDMLKGLILGIVTIWPVWLILLVSISWYKRVNRNRKTLQVVK